MNFKVIITSVIFFFVCVIFTAEPLEAQFLKNLKDKAQKEIDKRSPSDQNDEESRPDLPGSENRIETAEDFVAVYNSYSTYPTIKSDFEEAQALLREYFEDRSILCDNELYAIDNDRFAIYADLRPKTNLARLDEGLHEHFKKAWPYIWVLYSKDKSIKLSTRGNSNKNEAEWKEFDGLSKPQILNGKQFQAEGEIKSEMKYLWYASEEKGSWSTEGSFGYRLMKENDSVEIRPYNASASWFKVEVDNWHSTKWNENLSLIPENFGSIGKDEQCLILNRIATSN